MLSRKATVSVPVEFGQRDAAEGRGHELAPEPDEQE